LGIDISLNFLRLIRRGALANACICAWSSVWTSCRIKTALLGAYLRMHIAKAPEEIKVMSTAGTDGTIVYISA